MIFQASKNKILNFLFSGFCFLFDEEMSNLAFESKDGEILSSQLRGLQIMKLIKTIN